MARKKESSFALYRRIYLGTDLFKDSVDWILYQSNLMLQEITENLTSYLSLRVLYDLRTNGWRFVNLIELFDHQ